jgi:putative ABC transport system permease protein
MSARLLLRSLRRRGAALGLALVAVATGSGVAATMLTLKTDLRAKMSREVRRFGANLLVVPAEARPGASLEEAAVRAAGGPNLAPMVVALGSLRATRPGHDADGRAASGANAAIVGIDFAAHRRLNAYWRIEGAWPTATAAAEGSPVEPPAPALAGASLAARAGLHPGDEAEVHLAGSAVPLSIRLTGLVRTGEAEDGQLFLPLVIVQQAAGLQGRVTLAALQIEGGPDAVSRAATRLAAAIPGAEARPLRPVAAAQGAILDRLDRMMLLLTVVVLALSALCLATSLMTMVLEREPEIGLMRSLGASHGDVLRMFLGEVTLLGLTGGSAGLLLGMLAAHILGPRLFGASIEPRLAVVPTVLLISLGVSWTAVLPPLRRALQIRPAAALKGE